VTSLNEVQKNGILSFPMKKKIFEQESRQNHLLRLSWYEGLSFVQQCIKIPTALKGKFQEDFGMSHNTVEIL